MGTGFLEMSSWAALTLHNGVKTELYTKYMKSKYFQNFMQRILVLEVIRENAAYLREAAKKSSFLVV